MKGFFNRVCPLCQQNVDIERPDSFYLLPLHPDHGRLYSQGDWELKQPTLSIRAPNLTVNPYESYPTLEYNQRSLLIHQRCYALTGHLTPLQLRLLIDLVEPTFPKEFCPPSSRDGAFSAPSSSAVIPSMKQLAALPREILDRILEHDIGRLLLIMKAASQVSARPGRELGVVPEHRFDQEILTLNGDMIRIHVVDIGGRPYVSQLAEVVLPYPRERLQERELISSNRAPTFVIGTVVSVFLLSLVIWTPSQQWKPGSILFLAIIGFGFATSLKLLLSACPEPRTPASKTDGKAGRDYIFQGSTYLAVKTDGIGVIDIAFHQADNSPVWILGNEAHPFPAGVSVIRCADVRRIRTIRDFLKCRAIIPLNRTGAEPYFCTHLPCPPRESWIDCGFPIISRFRTLGAPFAHFTEATYVPFSTMRSIRFDVELDLGITNIDANHQDPEPRDSYFVARFKHFSAYFSQPPQSLRCTLCERTLIGGHTAQYPYIQFDIDGQWKPPLPHRSNGPQPPVLVQNVLGIWWRKSFPLTKLDIGIVVANKEGLQNTEL